MACWNNHPAGNLFCQSEVFHHSDGASFPLSPKLFIHFGHHDLLQVLNFANISLSELLRIISIHQTFWGRLTLTQTVFAPLSGNRAIFNVCLPDAPQVCGRGEKTPIEISYNRKSPTCFHWERELKVLQLSVIWQQSECFRAEVGVPRRGRFGEFRFRNISYVRKADNRLDCKVFAARPKKKKKRFQCHLAAWNYGPRRPGSQPYVSIGCWLIIPRDGPGYKLWSMHTREPSARSRPPEELENVSGKFLDGAPTGTSLS